MSELLTTINVWLGAANQWITDHKELLTLIAVPAITYFVTAILNRSAEQRASAEREAAEARASKEREQAEMRASKERQLQLELSRRMKLADFRQAWINELREDFAVILSVAPVKPRVSGEAGIDVNKRIQSVLLRMNPKDDGAQEIFDKLIELINTKKGDEEKIAFVLTNMTNTFLKKEWNRLKKELEDYQALGSRS